MCSGTKLTHVCELEASMAAWTQSGLHTDHHTEDAEYYSLDGGEKLTYLKMLIDESKSGRPMGPLHWTTMWLEFLNASSTGPDPDKRDEFYLLDIKAAVRNGLVANSFNLIISSATNSSQAFTPEILSEHLSDFYHRVSPGKPSEWVLR